MRPIIYLIIIGAAAYLGYNYYTTGKIVGKADDSATPAAVVATVPDDAPSSPAAPVKTVQVFKSKIRIPEGGAPGQKHIAPPGTYYVLERTSIEHAAGVAAVVPGEEVHLLDKRTSGVWKVTSGKYQFELKESQLTNDLEVAQEAERKFVATHPPSGQR